MIGKRTALYGALSIKEYKNVAHAVAKYARETMRLKDIEELAGTHVEKYLWSRIEEGIDRDTFAKECSAIEKLEVILNLYADNMGTEKTYDFQKEVTFMRALANEIMDSHVRSRAYKNPHAIVANVHDKGHSLEARMQLESGARIHEGSKITGGQLRGIEDDKYTGAHVGTITVKGKGGRVRDIRVSLGTYMEIKAIIDAKGVFKVKQSDYYKALETACAKVGETYDGSHGFRWCFVRRRLREVQEAGYSFGLTLRRGRVTRDSNPLLLPRDHAEGNWSIHDLRYFLSSD